MALAIGSELLLIERPVSREQLAFLQVELLDLVDIGGQLLLSTRRLLETPSRGHALRLKSQIGFFFSVVFIGLVLGF